MTALAPPATALLELDDLHKRYGGVRALAGAHLTVSGPGVIHGLIGANGSGKSTLLGILSGQVRPDEGRVALNGNAVHLTSPRESLAHGIAMVSQEIALAPALSIAENVFMGRMVHRGLTGVDWAETERRAADLLQDLGVDEDPRTPVGTLPPDRQQLIEIARALSQDPRVLILDEPTSSLDEDEVGALFAAVRRLRERGIAIIFVSHRMEELLALVDELTILRNGSTVAEGPIAGFSAHRIVDEMIGREGAWAEVEAPSREFVAPDAPPALRIRDLHVDGRVHGVDVDVHPGEVVGIAGIVGSGRHRVLEAVFGVVPGEGRIEINGEQFTPRGPAHAIDAGLAYLPPDRKGQGLVLQQSVAENLAAVATRHRGRLRLPGGATERELVDRAVASMGIVAASPDVPVSTLSGGNQQKVALGKWLAAEPRVFLLDEPTRGVDVAAKDEIHGLLRAAAARGMGLLVSSSEAEELLRVADVIVVLRNGRVAARLSSADTNEEEIAHYAGGHE
ncbi:MAG: sugar ABC transporter ATP-binding protein [Miltoncostaeaceae bacterium]